MLRIYVAGAYSGPDVLSVLDNMRRGMRLGVLVLLNKMAPFTPWHDYHHKLQLREDEELTLNDYYQYSVAWLEVSDAVLVVPEGAEQSKGTQAELVRAEELNIPIFYDMDELIEYKKVREYEEG